MKKLSLPLFLGGLVSVLLVPFAFAHAQTAPPSCPADLEGFVGDLNGFAVQLNSFAQVETDASVVSPLNAALKELYAAADARVTETGCSTSSDVSASASTPTGASAISFPATIIVTVPSLNVRSAPETSAPLAGSQVLYAGNTFTAVNEVAGDNVNGINLWWQSALGNYVWSGGTQVVSSGGGGGDAIGGNATLDVDIVNGPLNAAYGVTISGTTSNYSAGSQAFTLNAGDSFNVLPVSVSDYAITSSGNCTGGPTQANQTYICVLTYSPTSNSGSSAAGSKGGNTATSNAQLTVNVINPTGIVPDSAEDGFYTVSVEPDTYNAAGDYGAGGSYEIAPSAQFSVDGQSGDHYDFTSSGDCDSGNSDDATIVAVTGKSYTCTLTFSPDDESVSSAKLTVTVAGEIPDENAGYEVTASPDTYGAEGSYSADTNSFGLAEGASFSVKADDVKDYKTSLSGGCSNSAAGVAEGSSYTCTITYAADTDDMVCSCASGGDADCIDTTDDDPVAAPSDVCVPSTVPVGLVCTCFSGEASCETTDGKSAPVPSDISCSDGSGGNGNAGITGGVSGGNYSCTGNECQYVGSGQGQYGSSDCDNECSAEDAE